MFFKVKSNIIVLLSQGKGSFVYSPYLDSHGEIDIGLKKGKIQYLHQVRFDELRKQWLQHGLANMIARKIEAVSSRMKFQRAVLTSAFSLWIKEDGQQCRRIVHFHELLLHYMGKITESVFSHCERNFSHSKACRMGKDCKRNSTFYNFYFGLRRSIAIGPWTR